MARPSLTALTAHESNVATPAALAELLNRIQAVLVGALSYLFGLPLGRGQTLVTGVVLAAGTATAINHGLGRPIQGYVIVRSTGAARFTDADTSTPNVNVSITADANTTVSVLFF